MNPKNKKRSYSRNSMDIFELKNQNLIVENRKNFEFLSNFHGKNFQINH